MALRLVDAETGSEWDFTGWAVNGPLTGRQLARVTVLDDYWFGWKTYNPNTFLLIINRRLAMKHYGRNLIPGLVAIVMAASSAIMTRAQEPVTILEGAALTRVVPAGFYYQGLSAPTQMRNAAAARFGEKRYLIAALVDTSGYAADVRAKYEGFFITDSPIKINGLDLNVGAYGFGFGADGKMQILDLAGNQVLSTSTSKD
ncbi:MAG TPA: DUF3179 domain-containing (seleno)protein, partial [Pyrinomonadaceae bacterium]|nr:DUF3179 domain-containing (seleno)protein [Pyrinomonadaceae bacterium]